MNRKSSIIAFAVASLLGVGSVIAEGSMDSATVPEQNEVTSVNVTLQQPLVIDLGQGNLITLPIGTMIGREQTETKVNATGVTIGNETSLRNVTLIQDLTFTDPSTGLPVTLPSGTILRLNVEQRFDATGAVLVKNEFALRAAEPNGTVVRLNNKARTPQSAGGDEDNERSALRNVTLTTPLTIDLGGGNLVTLPTGTVIGREQVESRVNAAGTTVNMETSLRNVTLTQDLTFTDPSTGQVITLPSGTTIQRLKIEQRFDATGSVLVKNEFALRATEPNGTVVRLKSEALPTVAATLAVALAPTTVATRGRDGRSSSDERGRDDGGSSVATTPPTTTQTASVTQTTQTNRASTSSQSSHRGGEGGGSSGGSGNSGSGGGGGGHSGRH